MARPHEISCRDCLTAIFVAVAALCLGGAVATADEAALPRGDERVKSVWLFDVASELPFCADAAIADSEGLFVAGHAWSEADGERPWLWRIDRNGKRLWEKELIRPEISEEIKVVALLKPVRGNEAEVDGPSVTAVIRNGLRTTVRTYNVQGGAEGEVTLEGENYASGAVQLANGDQLVFGTEMQRSRQATPAWVARFDPEGKQVWRLALDPTVGAKRIMPWAQPALAPGHYHLNQLQAGVRMDDGSAVLVGVTGEYNKFGQGPSNLWLVRVSGDGEQLVQTLVKDDRFSGGAKDLIVRSGSDVLVPYTTAQLPPIGSVQLNETPSFGGRLTCFDATLESLWEKPLPNSAMPGAVAICGSGPYAMLSASADDVLVREVDGEGEELWESKTEAPESSVFPVAVVRRESEEDASTSQKSIGEIVAVCNYLRHPTRNEDEKPGPQVMVITAEAGR